MEISGAIIKSLPSLSGTNAKGSWIKRSFLIETQGPYPKTIKIEVFGDKGDILKSVGKGQMVRVQFDLQSRESNGKYYTEVTAYKIETTGDTPVGAPKAKPPVQQRVEREEVPLYDDDSDLPF